VVVGEQHADRHLFIIAVAGVAAYRRKFPSRRGGREPVGR
jgi:hypothetical protein